MTMEKGGRRATGARTWLLLACLGVLGFCAYSFRDDIRRAWFPERPQLTLIFVRTPTQRATKELSTYFKQEVLAGRFAEIDAYAAAHPSDFLADGTRARGATNLWVTTHETTHDELHRLVERADEWLEQNPDSLSARLIKIRAFIRLSAGYRNGKWGERDSREENALANADKAWSVFESSVAAGVRSASLYAHAIYVCRLRREPLARALALFNEGLQLEPSNLEVFGAVTSLLHLSEEGELKWEDFLDLKTAVDDEVASYQYMRVVCEFREDYDNLPASCSINWEKFNRGLAYAYRTFPDSERWKNYDALFSAQRGDLERARPLLVEIGAFANVDAWRHYEVLMECRAKCGLVSGIPPR